MEIKTSFLPSRSCWPVRKPDNKETESGAGATAGPGLSAGLPHTFQKNLMHIGVSGEVPPRFDFSLEKWWNRAGGRHRPGNAWKGSIKFEGQRGVEYHANHCRNVPPWQGKEANSNSKLSNLSKQEKLIIAQVRPHRQALGALWPKRARWNAEDPNRTCPVCSPPARPKGGH